MIGIELMKKVGGILDKVIPNADQKAKVKADLTALINKELTNRHQIDMSSNSWLSKNIRPLSLLIFTLIFTISIFTDFVGIEKMKIVENIIIPIYLFYFGNRTIEKGVLKGFFNKK